MDMVEGLNVAVAESLLRVMVNEVVPEIPVENETLSEGLGALEGIELIAMYKISVD